MNHKDNFHVTVNHKLSKKQVNWRRLRRGKPSECSFQLLVAAVQCGLYFALEESTRTSSFHSKMKMALFANMDAITGLPVLDGTRSAFHHVPLDFKQTGMNRSLLQNYSSPLRIADCHYVC